MLPSLTDSPHLQKDRVVKVVAEKATEALPKEIVALLSDEKPLSQASGVQASDASLAASVSAANQSSGKTLSRFQRKQFN